MLVLPLCIIVDSRRKQARDHELASALNQIGIECQVGVLIAKRGS
jgi:hypothetical protein